MFRCVFFPRISGQQDCHSKKYDIISSDMQIKLDVKCLQILRAVIHNEFVQIDPEEKERHPESYKK